MGTTTTRIDVDTLSLDVIRKQSFADLDTLRESCQPDLEAFRLKYLSLNSQLRCLWVLKDNQEAMRLYESLSNAWGTLKEKSPAPMTLIQFLKANQYKPTIRTCECGYGIVVLDAKQGFIAITDEFIRNNGHDAVSSAMGKQGFGISRVYSELDPSTGSMVYWYEVVPLQYEAHTDGPVGHATTTTMS